MVEGSGAIAMSRSTRASLALYSAVRDWMVIGDCPFVVGPDGNAQPDDGDVTRFVSPTVKARLMAKAGH